MKLEDLRDRFLAAQLEGDRREGLRLVMEEGLAAGRSVPELHLQVIQAAQHQIGEMWERNEISVAREHVASSLAQLALAQLYPHLPRTQANGFKAVVACVQGEYHNLAARMASDFLEIAGFEVVFMGADVPPEEIFSMMEETKAPVLALSMTVSLHFEALRATVDALRKARGNEVMVMVGGRAAEENEAAIKDLGVSCVGTDARKMVEEALTVLRRKAS
ncbi:MAG: cobalamin-dependent protein [Myxococcota bacterium]